jgi:hypothetical protein
MATCLLSYYGLHMWIHTYFVSLGLVMDIIAQYMLVCPVKHPNFDSHAEHLVLLLVCV